MLTITITITKIISDNENITDRHFVIGPKSDLTVVGYTIDYDFFSKLGNFNDLRFNLFLGYYSLLLCLGVQTAGVDQSSVNTDTYAKAACPASLRFKERYRPEATIIPACRARHGHHRALYTSTDNQLTVGKCRSRFHTVSLILLC